MSQRGPSHARPAAPRIAYRAPIDTRDARTVVLESTLPHGVMVDLLDAVRPDEDAIDCLAERLERHAPADGASPAACRRTALSMLERQAQQEK